MARRARRWQAGEGKGLPDPLAAILQKPEGQRNDEEKKSLEQGLRKHFDEKVRPGLVAKLPPLAKLNGLQKQLAAYKGDQLPRVMVMSDAQPRETKILSRGEYLNPTEKVSFATPAFLPPLPQGAPANRLGLAQWLLMPEHPLTARVQVNRMWQHFFGAGIVKTAEDFGVQSEYPLHGALLDWLAVEFRERGWSMKDMQRLIVTSATYRQSSRLTPELKSRDSENRLFARASRFRMPSLLLRDWSLAAAGMLDSRIGGAPVYPYQPERDLGSAGDHQGTRFHLSGVLRRRFVSPQPLHVLAAHGEPRQHVRCLESAGLPRAPVDHQHAAACPHHAQRSHLGRSRPRPRRAKPERRSCGDVDGQAHACISPRPRPAQHAARPDDTPPRLR